MRLLWALPVCALVVSAGNATAGQGTLTSGEIDRLRESAEVLTGIRKAPEAGIPDDLWRKAECVIVIPSVKKAAFIVGGEYGKGVATCRMDGGWSAPAFYELEKGSWGFQAGAESIDLVMLVMNEQGMNKILQDKVALGGGASVAAGPVGRTARANTDLQMGAQILSWSRSQGLFAGIDLNGGALHPDEEANARAYGSSVTTREILAKSSTRAPAAADGFLAAVRGEPAPAATTGRKPR